MNINQTINVAKDFTDAPGARYRADGPKSGEEFLEEHLEPGFKKAVETNAVLRVELDGTWGYASSFISGSFGALSKKFGAAKVRSHLLLVSAENSILLEQVYAEIDEYPAKPGG